MNLKDIAFGVTCLPFNWALNFDLEPGHWWIQIGPLAVDLAWRSDEELYIQELRSTGTQLGAYNKPHPTAYARRDH